MNRRDFFRGLLASTAIITTVSTKTIVDMAANTWRPTPAALGWGTTPVPGEFYRIRDDGAYRWVFPEHMERAGLLATAGFLGPAGSPLLEAP